MTDPDRRARLSGAGGDLLNWFVCGMMYFAVVFSAGFVLGTLRTLAVEPAVGGLTATLLELPLMLSVSWFAAGFVLRRRRRPMSLVGRLLMGAVAFAFLMVGELAISAVAFGRTPETHFALYQALEAQIGLAGQIAFAATPALRRVTPAQGKGAPG